MNNYYACAVAVTDVGRVSDINEDSCSLNGQIISTQSFKSEIFNIQSSCLAVVCDGISGEFGGEYASKAAVKAIKQSTSQLLSDKFSKSAFEYAVQLANSEVCKEGERFNKSVGTTIAMLGLYSDSVTIANVGDSRVYKYSGEKLVQLSMDHTKEQMLKNAGIIMNNPMDSHVLTQHLGINPSDMIIEPYIACDKASSGDIYLLCSDGLYDMVDSSRIKDLLGANSGIKEKADSLLAEALKNGGHDNITIILIEIN